MTTKHPSPFVVLAFRFTARQVTTGEFPHTHTRTAHTMDFNSESTLDFTTRQHFGYSSVSFYC